MPFQKGHAKIGGKVVGCKHKITKDVAGLLDKLNCNPIEGLATIANDPATPKAVRSYCFVRLAKFIHPELQSVQLTGANGGPIEHSDVSAREQLMDRIRGIAAARRPSGDTGGSDGGPGA